MSSAQPEPSYSQKGTKLSESMTFKQLIVYLVSLEERVSDMEETLDSSWENMSEKMTQMSFRNRRALSLRPVNRLKHVVDTSGSVVAGAVSVTELAIQTDSPSTSSVNQVHIGSHIKAIYLKVELSGSIAYGGVPRVYFVVFKNPGNQLANPVLDAIGVSTIRKYVIHQEMTMVAQQTTSGAGGGDGTFPRTMFKGVIRIPPRYQRFGDLDKLEFHIGNSPGEATGSTRWCLQAIYQEFF